MDLNEIFGYAADGAKWLAIGSVAYLLGLAGLSSITRVFSERVNSQEDLDRIVKEEVEKLGITKPIKANFQTSYAGGAKKIGEGNYEINIGGFAARRSMVRHELYHIRKGHCEKIREEIGINDLFNYLLKYEPQAIAYQVFGIKL
ncbi:hypothetical protein J4422_02710 [Candidatus Pacearchaeota archaeon]|nr:hypothetical protein [Candidatus Pacearchaeota archaeon]